MTEPPQRGRVFPPGPVQRPVQIKRTQLRHRIIRRPYGEAVGHQRAVGRVDRDRRGQNIICGRAIDQAEIREIYGNGFFGACYATNERLILKRRVDLLVRRQGEEVGHPARSPQFDDPAQIICRGKGGPHDDLLQRLIGVAGIGVDKKPAELGQRCDLKNRRDRAVGLILRRKIGPTPIGVFRDGFVPNLRISPKDHIKIDVKGRARAREPPNNKGRFRGNRQNRIRHRAGQGHVDRHIALRGARLIFKEGLHLIGEGVCAILSTQRSGLLIAQNPDQLIF